MAELKKVDEFQYDIPVMDEPVMDPEPELRKVQKNPNLPQSPKRKLRNISLLEKTLGFFIVGSDYWYSNSHHSSTYVNYSNDQ